MAPYPEEVDVFSAPHSRMKQLVDVYSEKLTCTDFKDYVALESLLHDLHHTFCEFKSHEQIENKYIMRKLKKRLKALSIHDAAVCNCHSDNKLSDMLALVKDGYSCTSKPEAERINFGIRLQNALQDFTGSFLPHMKEEEEVFQPMLMKYFEYEELKCLKDLVIKEHSKWHVYDLEKHTFEKAEVVQKIESTDKDLDCHFSLLPPEIVSHILSFLSPQDLLRSSEVCQQWYNISHEPSLWKEIYPCFWAHGIWSNYDESHEDCVEKFYPNSLHNDKYRDEDADIDEFETIEYGSSEDISSEINNGQNQKELSILQSIVKYLLPQVGIGVQKIVISSCRSLTSSLLRAILILCPNVVYLDVSYTSILDSAFKGLKEYSSCLNLQYLDLSGCKNITDLGLFRLADTMAMLLPHVPNGSSELRDVYLEDCRRFQNQCSFASGNSSDCLCDVEESGLWLQRSNPCYQCRADQFCSSVCFWQKNGVMCHLAKLSLQCPFVNSCEQLGKHSASGFFAPGASSILKTTATFVIDSSNCQTNKSKACDRKSLKYLNLSGCKEITDEGLSCLLEAGILQGLEFLDVSGCWHLTGSGLSAITDSLKYLKPENIFYCDQILDGPYPETANGCQNLESNSRACCCRMAS